jgi:5-methylcytosine-specific restriction endonuclease McrBC regulatory subunit McrC
MNILFEEFIAEFMKRNISSEIISVNSQVSNKYVFKNNKFNLRPDIIVNFQNFKKIVIDTKYKKLEKEKNNN